MACHSGSDAASVQAVESDRPSFRVYIGADDPVAALPKGVVPCRFRERAIGSITGLRAARTRNVGRSLTGRPRPIVSRPGSTRQPRPFED